MIATILYVDSLRAYHVAWPRSRLTRLCTGRQIFGFSDYCAPAFMDTPELTVVPYKGLTRVDFFFLFFVFLIREIRGIRRVPCSLSGPRATNPFLAPRCVPRRRGTARVVAGCTPADTRSPVWLQLRTGYILSSGSLSTVPKRESDDYSRGTRGARGKEKGERMVGKVNACTEARLCIGIKDVQRLYPRSVSPCLILFSFFNSFFFFLRNSTTSSGTHRQHSLWRAAYLAAFRRAFGKRSRGDAIFDGISRSRSSARRIRASCFAGNAPNVYSWANRPWTDNSTLRSITVVGRSEKRRRSEN